MEKILTRYLEFVIRRPWVVLFLVFMVTTAVTAWLVIDKPLRLDTNFDTLLPDDLPCVIESRRISSLIGSTDHLIVAVESPSVEDNMAFVDDMAEKLKTLPELEWVVTEQDKSYFRDRRLYYLDTVDLEKIVKRAKARLDYEKKIRNPFYVSLDDEEPPDIDFEDIMEKYRNKLERRGAKGLVDSYEEKEEKKESLDLGDRLASEDGTIMSVLARPSKPALNMDFGRELVKKTQALIEQANPRRNPGMKVEVAGAYRNRYREYGNIVGDIYSSLAVALGLIVLIIVVYFRRVRTVALILLPLVVGIMWTVGLTAFLLGRLNMTTALIFAVLLGLGIDFGVHMSVRYLDERARGHSLIDSLRMAVINTGKGILTAGLTTAGGMAVLVLARFRGFEEFGIIAMMGIFTCLVSCLLLMPSMAVVMEKISVPKPWRKRGRDQLGESAASQFISPFQMKAGLAVVAVVTLAGLVMTGFIKFEYNFDNLRGENVSSSIHYGKTLGQVSSPVVAVMPTAEDARHLTRHIEDIIDKDTKDEDLIKRAFSLWSFVPDDQGKKAELLAELKNYVESALKLEELKEKTRERLDDILRWSGVGRVQVDDLPEWVLSKFREKDQTLGRMVYIYPRINEWNVLETREFYEKYGTIDVPGRGQVMSSSSGFILVEVVQAVKRDGWLITVAALAVVLFVLIADHRSVKKAAIVFIPLLVGASWIALIMVFFDLKLGIYNMLVLPTLLGIGVDASVHLFHSYEEHGPGSLKYVMKTTGSAVVIAAATTGVGFAGMMVVSHAGLRSIGILAFVGILATLAAALITMPLLLRLVESLKARTGRSD